MKSLGSALVRSHVSLRGSRRAAVRLLSLSLAALLLSGLLLVTVTRVAVAASGDWPQFQGGPAHDGYNAQEDTLSPLNLVNLGVAWTGATGRYARSPVVADGVAFVGSRGDGNLYAFAVDCASGGGTCTPLWTGVIGGAIDSPAMANGVVYVGSPDGKLYAYDATGVTGCGGSPKTCSPLWTATTGGTNVSSPAIADGVVYVGSGDGQLYAYDATGVTGCGGSPKTCSPLWKGAKNLNWHPGGNDASAPAVADGVVYIDTDYSYSGHTELEAFAVGCSNGGGTCTPLWTASTAGDEPEGTTPPTVADGVVYVSSETLYAFAVGCASGGGTCTPLWTAAPVGDVGHPSSSPAAANGVVYVASWDGKLYAFDATGVTGCSGSPKTCSPLWTGATSGQARSSPAVANGVVYIASWDGKLYAFAVGCSSGGGTCSPLWSGRAGNATAISSPAVANGVVYVGSDNSGLVAFDLHKTLTVSGIPSPDLAGSVQSVTVTAKDGVSGNVAVDYRGTIHFTSSDPKAVLPADYTFTTADAGVHTFSVSLKTAGTQSVTATDTATASIKGTQSGIVVQANDATGATFYAVTPGRVLDSRISLGAGLFHSRTKQSFQVTGLHGVPAGAVAVTGNVTIVGQTRTGYVTVAPSLTSGVQPPTSTINFPKGDTRANGITVPLGAGGKLDAMYWSASTADTVNVIFDVTGYFANDATGATFYAVTPGRVLDSRISLGAGTFHSRTKRSFQATGLHGVPAGAVAVTGNVTIVGQTRTGYVTIAPSLTSGVQPPTSTINFPKGDTRANGITVPLGAGGKLDAMYWSASTADTVNVIFDVTGYFS